MDLEKLKAGALEAQGLVAEHIVFDRGCREAEAEAKALQTRLDAINTQFASLFQLYADPKVGRLTVTLDTIPPVEPVEGQESAARAPHGKVKAVVEKVEKQGDDYHKTRKLGTIGYKVRYDLVTPVIVGRNNQNPLTKTMKDMTETTMWDGETPGTFSAWKDQHHKVQFFNNESFDVGGPEALADYNEKYLAHRAQQIEGLEETLQILKEALEDPERNAWAVEIIEKKKAAAEEAERLKAELEAEAQASVDEEQLAVAGLTASARSRTKRWRRS